MTSAVAPPAELSRRELILLTVGKTITNVALRWIPFFLPTLGRALGAGKAEMTRVVGFGEMAGLFTAAVGRQLEGGRERRIMTGGMLLVGVSTVLAIVGNFWVFAFAQFLLMLGVSFYTVAGHAYISRRVSFDRRGRSIGIFELSWAIGLLVGAPVAAWLIEGVSWRAPFVAVGILAFGFSAGLLVADRRLAQAGVAPSLEAPPRQKLNANGWYAVIASAGIALAGLSTIVILGTWMEDSLGVSTRGIGLVAILFGIAELCSSTLSASFSDRLGKLRSTRIALILLTIGLGVMVLAGTSLVIGVLGMGFFFLGFEYSIVTSFSVVSEAMPDARGSVLAVNMAAGTVARGAGSVASGELYESFGIGATAALAATGAVVAIAFLGLVDEQD